MSTEQILDLKTDSKITISYTDTSSDSIKYVTGQIKKVSGQSVVVHNNKINTSINFDMETNSGKILDAKDEKVTNINVKTYREWEYNHEAHIILPSEDEIRSDNKHSIILSGNKKDIVFTDIVFTVNGHRVGVMYRKNDGWDISDVRDTGDHGKIVSCDFHSVTSEYDAIYIATEYAISSVDFDKWYQ
jgi:hypothetical protein